MNTYWAGHFLQFEPKPRSDYDSGTGLRLLLIFITMEIILGPRFALATWLGIPVPEAAIRVPLLLLLAFVLIRFLGKINVSQLGLYSWKHWSSTERWYFIQVLILANVIFGTLLFSKLNIIWTHPAMWGTAAGVLIVQLLWGFYQELIYRGVLQTELVRRWGTWTGILISNIIFTFGPLHLYHFRTAAENPPHAWIFAAIFAIGLFFGVLFQRSGNLWMIGIFHGIGDLYLTGLQQVVDS